MSVGFGFSIGDILACGKFCHQIYKACFSEAHDASAAWAGLGKELVLLGDALQNLCSDDGIIPQDPFCGPEKEQRALEAVRVVVGDFQETLKDLRAFLLRYDDFRKPDAGKQYWLKIRFSVNSGEVDKFRARVAMHSRAVDLLLNPLIYQSTRNVEDTVTNIQTRIDTIDQVLHALLVVASEQLTTTSSSRNPRRIADRAYTRLQNGHPQYFITESPRNPRAIPALPAANKDTPRGGERIFRTNSYPTRVDQYEDPIEMGLRRPSTETNMMNTHSPTSSYPPSSGRGHPANRGGDERYPTRFSPTSTGTDPSGYGTQRQGSSSGATELSENPISRALRQSAMSEGGSAKKRPIEHWVTAAMHWYFKAEKDLKDPDRPEVSLEAYLGLMKSSWIVENINRWEAEDGLPEEIKRNIETLVVLIVDQFRKIRDREMPDIKNINPQDYEIWHKDIVRVLVEPASPLPSRASSRQSTFGGVVYYDDPRPPRRPSQTSSSHTRATTPPDFDPLHENFSGPPASRPSPSLPSSSRTSSLRSSKNGQDSPNPPEPTRANGRSPSISTTSTGSSGRRESFTSTYPTPTFPVQVSEKPAVKRRPVPASPTSYPTTTILQPPDDDPESYEGLDERTILNATEIMWASQVSGPFQRGTVTVFWHQSTRFFRIYTRYSPRRAHSQEVSLRDTEMIPEYAYEGEPTIYLRRTARLPGLKNGPKNGPPTASPTVGGDTTRIGHVYKFHTSESMLDFQRALTSERVYLDLVKRVASVKFKRSSENGTHSYHDARLQLWHENPPAEALFTDVASGMTGVSQATCAKLVLSCSRLMIYFGGSGSFLTCFLTDDISLEREDQKLMLVPTKYGGSLWKSPKTAKPKTVKAAIRGSETCKGGFKLDKDRISPDDEYRFEDFSYIHINFKDVEFLNKFQKLWNEMMAMRRAERARIRDLKEKLQGATWAPLAVS